MKRGQKVRAAFVVTVAVGGTIAAGCSSERQLIVNPPPETSTCPSTAPAPGGVCSLRAGVMCSIPGQSCPPYQAATDFTCVNARWQVTERSCNPHPPTDGDASMVDATSDACPMGPPMVGGACSRGDTTPCSYSFPCPGNFPGSALYACVSGRWESQGGAACNPPVDGGASGDVPGGG